MVRFLCLDSETTGITYRRPMRLSASSLNMSPGVIGSLINDWIERREERAIELENEEIEKEKIAAGIIKYGKSKG